MPQPDPAEFRRAVSRFATGVTLVAVRCRDDRIVAMTANSFTSVSLAPPTVLISVTQGRTLKAIEESGRFAVNVLPASSRKLSDHFAGRRVPGLVPEFEDIAGSPRLAGAIAHFDCRVERSVAVADHTVLIGTVRDCRHLDAEPLVFYGSRYRNLAIGPPA